MHSEGGQDDEVSGLLQCAAGKADIGAEDEDRGQRSKRNHHQR